MTCTTWPGARVARRTNCSSFYVVERFLYRVSCSPYADQLVLKGGMLLAVLDARRTTRDALPSRRHRLSADPYRREIIFHIATWNDAVGLPRLALDAGGVSAPLARTATRAPVQRRAELGHYGRALAPGRRQRRENHSAARACVRAPVLLHCN
jgi:hypothetical protein